MVTNLRFDGSQLNYCTKYVSLRRRMRRTMSVTRDATRDQVPSVTSITTSPPHPHYSLNGCGGIYDENCNYQYLCPVASRAQSRIHCNQLDLDLRSWSFRGNRNRGPVTGSRSFGSRQSIGQRQEQPRAEQPK